MFILILVNQFQEDDSLNHEPGVEEHAFFAWSDGACQVAIDGSANLRGEADVEKHKAEEFGRGKIKKVLTPRAQDMSNKK